MQIIKISQANIKDLWRCYRQRTILKLNLRNVFMSVLRKIIHHTVRSVAMTVNRGFCSVRTNVFYPP